MALTARLFIRAGCVNLYQRQRDFNELLPYSHILSRSLCWCLCTRQQFREVVVHTRHAKIWLASKWPAHIIHLVRTIQPEFDDRQDKVIGLVERVQNLVLRDSDRRRALDAALDLQEAQLAGLRIVALNIITEPLELAV